MTWFVVLALRFLRTIHLDALPVQGSLLLVGGVQFVAHVAFGGVGAVQRARRVPWAVRGARVGVAVRSLQGVARRVQRAGHRFGHWALLRPAALLVGRLIVLGYAALGTSQALGDGLLRRGVQLRGAFR
jgi:hypothetical protein